MYLLIRATGGIRLAASGPVLVYVFRELTYNAGRKKNAAAAISTPFPAFDDSDVLTESDFNLFDADHTSQDAL